MSDDFFAKMKRLITCKGGVNIYHVGGESKLEVDELTGRVVGRHMTLWAFECRADGRLDIIADIRQSNGTHENARVRFATPEEVDACGDQGKLAGLGYW